MPTILRQGPYRFYFLAADRVEPPHVHVRRDRGRAKFQQDPVRLASGGRFGGAELRRIEAVVREHRARLLGDWHERFGSSH